MRARLKVQNLQWHRRFLDPWPKASNIARALLERKYPRTVRRRHVFYSRSQARQDAKAAHSYSLLRRVRKPNRLRALRLIRKLRKPHWPSLAGTLQGYATVMRRLSKPAPVNSMWGTHRFNKKSSR